MFSKEEASKLRQEFWTSFGKSFPRKWLLYNTKIKDLSLKFFAGRKKATVMIAIEMKDAKKRDAYFDKFLALKSLFQEELPGLEYETNHRLETGKIIHRIYLELPNVSIYNKDTWQNIYEFFNKNMDILENLFLEHKDYITDI